MLGWEFPPYISGGLGTACYGLTRAMSRLGMEILFVLPRAVPAEQTSHVRLLSSVQRTSAPAPAGPSVGRAEMEDLPTVRFYTVAAALRPYDRPGSTAESARSPGARADETGPASRLALEKGAPEPGHYAGDLFGEVERYARLACQVAAGETFDVIHAHDWMTYPAGAAVARQSGKPLVVHVHSTEFDRSGLQVNQRVYDVERRGMQAADAIVTVSRLTRNIVTRRYGVSPDKVQVVYNGIEFQHRPSPLRLSPAQKRHKIVLFLGRVTMQKGPEFFIAAARRVAEVMDDARFIVAGSGDRLRGIMDMTERLGLADRVLFTGFLRGPAVQRVYRMADVYVMPSVSEPFGITPLEAISHGVPAIISKQSGVAEILDCVLKVDFWDTEELARMIIAVLQHPELHARLRDSGRRDLQKLSWEPAARRCLEVYRKVIRR